MHPRSSARHQTPPDEKFVILNHLRPKIVNLHIVPLQKVLRDTDEHDKQPHEQPSFPRPAHAERRSARLIRHIQDEVQTHNSRLAIMHVFMTHFRKKYDIIKVDECCINPMTVTISQPPDMPYMEHLNQQIDIDEIHQAVLAGSRQKFPGSEGLELEFYKPHWTTIKDRLHTILNQMYFNKAITPQQNTA